MYTLCMHKKEPQKLPEHITEHVKSQNFLGACSETSLTQSILFTPVFALGPLIVPAAQIIICQCIVLSDCVRKVSICVTFPMHVRNCVQCFLLREMQNYHRIVINNCEHSKWKLG